MAVRLHYRATRPAPLTPDEVAVARGLVAAHNADYPFDADALDLTDPGDASLQGSTTLPQQDPFATFLGLAHWCRALTDVRRALPGTSWQVSVDDDPVPWDDEAGFGWPEQRDPTLLASMQQMRSRV
ncbi:MAG: hypothetical protein J7503_07140 [Cellulomonas iranensis]|uniref:Uncharacterized protein n=1 Tax=Cellulomonas iranensis TaxID=76862 RepID=A0ABU0GJ26_9CELL|nr:hypothetical protein [Cellulomonas iranensis]MBO9568584.1 hypothetical protein [Cellulomonas iranensis]MDQ0425063.1 hypothetical protein [Cellulomonas iranensis]UCN14510.1 hypothetical protein LFM56_16875 [Cellulomonas iranensis]